MKYEQSRTTLSAQSAEESIAGKRKAKSLQWKELVKEIIFYRISNYWEGTREISGGN